VARQAVIVKGQRDGISIMLDESIEFEQLKEVFREKVSGAKRFFEGANTSVSFKGRTLSENEEQNLLDIILAETTLRVDFVEGDGFIAPVPQAQPSPPANASSKNQPASKIDSVAPARLGYSESNTAYYRGGLRSGQSIKSSGSVVIMGDVNPGSEVVADGNVIILGALKGMAHAGAAGDDSCFVSALVMQPTQLRISSIITYIPAPAKGTKNSQAASYAYIKDDQVFVAQL